MGASVSLVVEAVATLRIRGSSNRTVKKGSKIIGKNFVPKNSPEITGFFVEKSGATAPLALLGSKISTCARAAGLPIRREAGVAPNFSR